MKKRTLEIVVISDIHLGTFGCQAKHLINYLKSIKPKILILNGDIIDIWQFSKHYFPKSHIAVIQQLFKLAAKGTTVYYITGNHDEALRKFTDLNMGNITLTNKLVLPIDGKQAWFFHGDIFDRSIQQSKWLAKLGGWGYDLLILMNQSLNWTLEQMGKEKFSLSKKIKYAVKQAVSYINDFEMVAAELAIAQGYDYVVCGHIHQPKIKEITTSKGSCVYLNSGDWVENLTALEYENGDWSLYSHQPNIPSPTITKRLFPVSDNNDVVEILPA